jgi:hypothetical protein
VRKLTLGDSPKAFAQEAALNVVAELETNQLDPADLEAVVIAECRKMFGTVMGPEDSVLWPLHVEIFHRVLEVGGAIAVDGSQGRFWRG